MWKGISCGICASALWAMTYLLPIWLPTYSTMRISLGRALVMGLSAIVGIWIHKSWLSSVTIKDWLFATLLSIVGTVIEPWLLFSSVEYAGVALAATFFGIIPVLVAVIANERDRRKGKLYVPLRKLTIPLTILFVGLLLSNAEGLIQSLTSVTETYKFALGCLFGIGSTATWTWYPIKNADWLLDHPTVSPVFFAEMQGIVLVPVGLVCFAFLYLFEPIQTFIGPAPWKFWFFMFIGGFLGSYVPTALWNAMSQIVPTAIVGPMLVFETIFSVSFGLIYAHKLPSISLTCGMVLLVIGVVSTLGLFNYYLKKQKLHAS